MIRDTTVLFSAVSTKANGLLTIVLICFHVNVASNLVHRLPNSHSLIPKIGDLNPGQSVSLNANNKAFACIAKSDWIGTVFVQGSCDAALSRLYVTEVTRYQSRM